jgi:arylsulfatase A-like enzyme
VWDFVGGSRYIVGMSQQFSRFCRLVGLALVVTVCAGGWVFGREGAGEAPNVLLILSDDHSAAHVGCYGNPDVRTPNLDRLAGEGMRFERAYVAAPQCVPSRASILTGRHPLDIGMTRFSAALPEDVVTFPELLRKERGYYTGVCGRSFHLQGSVWNQPAVRSHLSDGEVPDFARRMDYVKVAAGENLRAETLGQLREFLGQVPEGKPFFLQLCWSDPHRPLTGEELPHKHDPAGLTLPPFYPDAPAIRKDLAAYYDEVGRMDGDVGRVLKVLEERGVAGETVVIFMGDNGASQLRGKGTLNELGIRVPLIVRWPGGVKAGTKTDALVSGEDVAPTVLEIVGVERPKNLTGVSVLPLLRGERTAAPLREQVVAERGPHASGLPRGTASFDLGRVVVTDRYKLIYNVLWQLPYEPVDFNLKEIRALDEAGKLDGKLAKLYLSEHRPMFELYDLREDPWEMNNLAGKAAAKEVEEELKGRLAAWMIRHRDVVPLPVARRP